MKPKKLKATPTVSKRCQSCNKIKSPGERHRMCWACRKTTQEHVCPTCKKIILKRYRACVTCTNKARVGSLNGNWRGGGTYHKKGYIMRGAKGHPRAAGKGNYVFEHILLMEEHLGRFLYPGENVHHKNGVKNDNGITNLELWTRPQPAGVRAKDLLEWARTIIKKYEPIEDKL